MLAILERQPSSEKQTTNTDSWHPSSRHGNSVLLLQSFVYIQPPQPQTDIRRLPILGESEIRQFAHANNDAAFIARETGILQMSSAPDGELDVEESA